MHSVFTPEEIAELGIPTAYASLDSASIVDRLDRVPESVRGDVRKLLDESAASLDERDQESFVVLHDDFHFGNVVLDAPVGELVGVWDFSCVHLGAPSVDLRYLVGGSADLLRRVADEYERQSGRGLDLRVATLAHRLEVVSDALDLDEPETLVDAVQRWRAPE